MRRKLLSLFFLVLAIFLVTPQAHATSSYIGMVAGQLGSSTCPPTGGNCGGPGGTNGANDNGDGVLMAAPFNGQLASISIFTGAQLPNNVVILTGTTTKPGFDPVGFTANAGYSMTVADKEILSGLSATTFTTISLASPVTVTIGQWVAVVVTANCAFPSNCFEIMFCGNSGASPSCASTYAPGNFLNSGFSFGGSTGFAPSSGSFSTINLGGDGGGVGSNGGGFLMGASFQTVGSPQQFTTQCYGNCGSPPITLTNVNATHTVNWNQSITLFYQFTSNLNGFVNNVTFSASSFQSSNPVQVGLYLASCQSGQVAFTTQCPGFLQSQATFATLFKGKTSLPMNIPVTNGQTVGISISGTSKGLDLNGTNVQLPIFQTSGRTPAQIAFSSQFDGASQIGLWAWVSGSTITNGPSAGNTFNGGGGCITCGLTDFVGALGGGTLGAIIGFGIIFSIVAGGLLYATRIHHPKSQGGGIKGYALPMEMLTLIFVLMLIAFSAAGVLPPYIPLLVIAIVAFLFTQAIWGHRRGTSTSPVTN